MGYFALIRLTEPFELLVLLTYYFPDGKLSVESIALKPLFR